MHVCIECILYIRIANYIRMYICYLQYYAYQAKIKSYSYVHKCLRECVYLCMYVHIYVRMSN